MSASGKVTSVDAVSGAAELSAAVSSGDDVLLVGDASGFDEDFLERRYLAIGDDLVPHEYVAVENDDEGQQSVTLAVTAGDSYEAGLPVYLWDPEADGDDKRAVEIDAQVRIDGQDEAVPVTIRHALAPQANALVGATVTIGEGDDGEPVVDDVRSRKSVITGTTFQTAEDGQRIVIRHYVNQGLILLYTGNDSEEPPSPGALGGPGYLATGVSDFGAAGVNFQTVLSAPSVEGSGEAATLALISSESGEGGPVTTYAQLAADEVQAFGDLTVSGAIGRGGWAGGGTSDAEIDNLGRIVRKTSSLTAKDAVKPMTADEAASVLAFEPVTFQWRDPARGDTRVPGFIAEQVDEVGGLWATHDSDGAATGVRYPEMTAALVALVRDQQARIERLESRLAEHD